MRTTVSIGNTVDTQSRHSIDFRTITCIFPPPEKNGKSYTAIKDVSLRIGAGEFVSIVGPTGCGKSTLLNIAAGLIFPSSGQIEVFGVPLAGLNRHAGYMFQSDSLLPWLRARDNVALGPEIRGASRPAAADISNDWLRRVGLKGHEERYPHQLSGGMKKRVSLAQCLVMNPKILLMDEPFSALDVQTRQLMENELLELWAEDKKSVLFVTHDLEEAISLGDRVVVLSAGPASTIIAEFPVNIPRPRNVMEIVQSPDYLDLNRRIWDCLKAEVLKSYMRTKN
jgi:NitT/TauT family transport system ATP-binding protein